MPIHAGLFLRPRDRRVGEDLVLLRAVAFTSKALLL
jgi:hypothetical protein